MRTIISHVISAEGQKEWRENWPLVLSAMAGFATSMIHMYSLGIMIPSLETEFGWSRAQITFGLLIVSMIVFPMSPVIGLAIDRLGPRKVAITGTLVYCSALAALSLAQQPIWTWWALWVFVALGHLCLSATVWVAAVSSMFIASRGLALAVALSATGLISFVTPVSTFYLIEQFGWRMAYIIWGVISVCITLPLLLMFFSSEKDRAGHRKTPGPQSQPALTSGMEVREAFLSASFVKLATVNFIMANVTVALLVNMVPILSSSGIAMEAAAAIAGIIGVFQIIGRLSGGALLDRFNARLIGAISMFLPVITCLMLIAFPGSNAMAIVAIVILGLSLGAELDVIAYLAGRYFGLRKFGVIFGGMVALMTLGIGLGPVLANLVYDATGTYFPVLWAAIPLALTASLILLMLGPYPIFDNGSDH